jgi:hypothetical protein
VLEMVDRERRDDGVETSERGERRGEVVLDELDAVVIGKPLACRLEHEIGEVKAHAAHLAPIDLEKGEQAAVARPEVEDATSVVGDMLEQDALSLRSARISIRPVEIPSYMLRRRPLVVGWVLTIRLSHRPERKRNPFVGAPLDRRPET